MINTVDFAGNIDSTSSYTLPESISKICVTVDNGRLYIYIDDIEIVSTYLTDGSIDINKLQNYVL